MPEFTFTNSTYAGDVLAGYMASTLLEADSVKRGLLTVIPDVKFKKVILDVDDEVVLQDPNPVFTDQNTTTTQNESYLEPIKYEFMKQETWEQLRLTWEAEQLKPGSLADYEGVVELSDFVAARYQVKLSIANERLYWLGKKGTKEASFTAAYPGLLADMAASSETFKIDLTGAGKPTYLAITGITVTANQAIVTVASTTTLKDGDVVTINVGANVRVLTETTTKTVGTQVIRGTNYNKNMLNNVQDYYIQVLSATTFKLLRNYSDINTRIPATFTDAGTGAATTGGATYINASNVIGVLGSVYAQLDYADRDKPDFNLQVPRHVGYAYAQAQGALATNVLNAFPDVKKMDYFGIPLQLMNHFAGNTIVGARSSNLFLGVDLLSDVNHFSTVYMAPYTNDNLIRTKASMKSDTTVKFFNEVLYLSTNS